LFILVTEEELWRTGPRHKEYRHFLRQNFKVPKLPFLN
jgi:hypothetical protein